MLQTLETRILEILFFQILRIRLIEERIVGLYPQQQMRCPVHLCIGQEAVAVGVCQALNKEDLVLSNHRAHGHYLARGGDLKRFFAELYGKKTGCSKGRGGSMHLIDLDVNFLGSTPIVASSVPLATGVAFAEMLQGRPSVTVIFLGDAAMEEGAVHECINFAALKKLPLLFVCENNFYSVYTPLSERQPQRDLVNIARAHGIPSWKADGNDGLRVYETAKHVLDKMRVGIGPAFIEFTTYRWREHCGPNYDNNIGYRPEQEFAEWKRQCPVERLQQQLLSENILDMPTIQLVTDEIQQEIDAAVIFAQTSPFPHEVLREKDVYAE